MIRRFAIGKLKIYKLFFVSLELKNYAFFSSNSTNSNKK